MATAISTAAPKVSPPSEIGAALPFPKKITLHRTSVRMNSAVMVTVLILPRLVMPILIQRIISRPITSAHSQMPVFQMALADSAPS